MARGCLILIACGCGAVLWASGPARGATPAAEERPTMLDREQLSRWGAEVLDRIEKDLGQPPSALYAEYGTPDGKRGGDFGKYSFVWPAGFQLRALAAAARVKPDEYRERLVRFAEALDAYWTVRDGIGGYQVLPGKSERFYDDNAWLALGLIETYEITGRKRFLDRATETLEFVASGEAKTPGGGIRQHEDKPGNTSVCTTAPATVAALRLYQVRKDRRWLERAARWYAWLTSKEVGVQDPQDGLFDDQAGYADGRWKVVHGKRAYNTALPMRAAVLLARIKKDAAYLAEAQRMAAAAVAHWVRPSGAMHETGQWGGSDLVDALLDLYAADRDTRWPAAVARVLAWLHENGRDPQGRYAEEWSGDHRTRPMEKFHLLYMTPVARAYWRAAASGAAPKRGEDVLARGGVGNARIRFETARKGDVAFLGGSITEMDGYRPMVAEMLRKRFPETAFEFTSAGIASTCSTTGAFRLADDVLAKGPADLVFVEFAVNDDQDAHHTREECVRGMEGIVRHLRRHNPRADVVFVYFVNESMMETYRKGETPLPVGAHEAVAARYGVPSIHLARAVTRRIDAGEFTWQDYGGVHPAPFGNRIAADLVGALFEACWKEPLGPGAAAKEHPLPAPLDAQNYEGGRFLPVREARLGEGWRVGVPDWAALAGGKRDRFTQLDILEATRPGARLTLDFRGSCLGAYVLAGPDAGIVEASVDGGAARRVDLWHAFSEGLHYPRTVLLAEGLAPGKHTLVLTVAAERNAKSQGTAARIMHFAVNDGADAGPGR